MALKYLGASLDIHGGGADLIFPHHESEIAQSESATGVEPFARFWMHTAMVYMDGEKMSKSLGNMVFARDLMESHGADAVRLYILRCRYRTELHWNPAELDRARDLAGELAAAAVVSASGPPSPIDIASYRARFFDRMNDDLDTPAAIEVLLDLARAIRGDASGGLDVSAPVALLRELGDILGLTFEDRSPLVLPAEDGSSGRIAK
jgi:cysteinyl-tRNA synthetase